jgi:type IV secretion system protein VirB6
MPTPAIAPFTKIYAFFDQTVVGTLTTGTANMMALVSPLAAACFSIYVTLILLSYMRGDDHDEPVIDFLTRMIGWGAAITFGLNIDTYTTYVVPFVNGLGEDLASVIGPQYGSAAALDQMANAFADSFINLYNAADGIKESVFAALAILLIGIFAGLFMVVAIAYIVLAKVALGLLIAIGPLFIIAAIFPATRDLFRNWTGQCLNYAFLVMLFSFAAQLEIQMVKSVIPSDLSISTVLQVSLICAVTVFVSLNLPSLASALAGGVGISSMVGKFRSLPSAPEIGKGKGAGTNEIRPGGDYIPPGIHPSSSPGSPIGSEQKTP